MVHVVDVVGGMLACLVKGADAAGRWLSSLMRCGRVHGQISGQQHSSMPLIAWHSTRPRLRHSMERRPSLAASDCFPVELCLLAGWIKKWRALARCPCPRCCSSCRLGQCVLQGRPVALSAKLTYAVKVSRQVETRSGITLIPSLSPAHGFTRHTQTHNHWPRNKRALVPGLRSLRCLLARLVIHAVARAGLLAVLPRRCCSWVRCLPCWATPFFEAITNPPRANWYGVM